MAWQRRRHPISGWTEAGEGAEVGGDEEGGVDGGSDKVGPRAPWRRRSGEQVVNVGDAALGELAHFDQQSEGAGEGGVEDEGEAVGIAGNSIQRAQQLRARIRAQSLQVQCAAVQRWQRHRRSARSRIRMTKKALSRLVFALPLSSTTPLSTEPGSNVSGGHRLCQEAHHGVHPRQLEADEALHQARSHRSAPNLEPALNPAPSASCAPALLRESVPSACTCSRLR